MIPPFVKKFDFRGEYGKDIHDQDAFYLGLALKKTIPLKKVLIGWDTRESSRNLAYNFLTALQGSDIELYYMDKCPIDYVTAASNACDFDLSVMFTGSHNPWTWTGLLMHTKGGDSIQGQLVSKIIENYKASLKTPYQKDQVKLSDFTNFYEETEKIYAEKIKSLIPLTNIKNLSVLVDVGDGSGSVSLSLLEKLLPQITVTRIHNRKLYDENSIHTADPSNIENMKDLIQGMKDNSYNVGCAFDSDADRMLCVDETGEYINGSLLGSVHISTFVSLGLDTKFGYAVDCGLSTPNCVKKMKDENNSLSVQAIPVGRSMVRQMLREGRIDFGVENVGHFYCKDFFMTDSGVFSLVVTLYWMSTHGPLSSVNTLYPDGFRDQIFTSVLSNEKIEKVTVELSEQFKSQRSEKITLDGIRYEYYTNNLITSWYTIRKSGYEAITKCYFGALDEGSFNILKKQFGGFT